MSRGPEENSGLIDLDRLMREAHDSERTVAATPVALTPPPFDEAPAKPPPADRVAASRGREASSPRPEAKAKTKTKSVEKALPPRAERAEHAAARPKDAALTKRDERREKVKAAPPAEEVGTKTSPSPKVVGVGRVAKTKSVPDVESSTAITSVVSTEVAAVTPATARRGRLIGAVAAAALLTLGVARFALAPEASPTAAKEQSGAVTPEPARAAAAPAPVEPAGLDPSSLPNEGDEPEPAPTPTVANANAKDVAPSRVARAGHAAPPSPAAEATAAITAKDLAAVSSEGGEDLGSAMRTAVGPRDDREATGASPESASGARQLRPSQGAVASAIGTVLPAARACLGPDAAVRSGSLVFASDGTVQSIDLRGAKAEDPCIRSALSKARVEPFSQGSYSTRVTVRP